MSTCPFCGAMRSRWDCVNELPFSRPSFGIAAICPNLCDVDVPMAFAIGREVGGVYHTYDFGMPEPKEVDE